MEKGGPLFAWSGPHPFTHQQQAALDAVPLRPWEPPTELVPLPRKRKRQPRAYRALLTIEDWEEERERRKRVGAKVARET